MPTASPYHRLTVSFLLSLRALVPPCLCAFSASAQTLQYSEVSTGIDHPTWDGGRTELCIADVNLDGHPDLLSIGDHGSPFINTDMHGITVWFGDGANNYTLFQNGDFGYGGIAIGDLNNDGLPDAAYSVHHNYSQTDFGNQLTEAALGDGTGKNWTPWDDGLGQDGQDYGMFGTVLADFDADGLLDIASNAFGYDDGVHVYRNYGGGWWSQSSGFIGGNSTEDIATGDVNNDGRPDLAVAHQFGSILLNLGDGYFDFSDAGLPGGGNLGRAGPSLGDVDLDGRDDFAYATPTGGVQVYLRTADDNWQKASTGLPTSGPFEATALADMDADGNLDLVAFGSGTVKVYRADQGLNWSQAASFTLPAPGSYAALTVGDMDHNGRPDIALVSEVSNGPFDYTNILHIFSETTTPDTLSALITSPTPHHTLRTRAAMFIDWLAAVPPGLTATIALDISTAGPDGPWKPLAFGLPSSGRHQLVLQSLWDTDNAYLRLTADTGHEQFTTLRGPYTITGGCYPDCDQSGALDFFDFLCYINSWDGEYYPDCDRDGTLDYFDFLCFVNLFNAGC
jgi:hypothetical protein